MIFAVFALQPNIHVYYLPFEVSTFVPITRETLRKNEVKIGVREAKWILHVASKNISKKPARSFNIGLARLELQFDKMNLEMDQTGAFTLNACAGVFEKKQLDEFVTFLRKHLKKPDGSPVSRIGD